MDAPASPAKLYMDAVLRPNRSLSKRGFFVMLAILAWFNGVMALFFLVIGALPIPVFLGLDFLGLYIAFRVSYRRGGTAERVQVSAEQVIVRHEFPRGALEVWRSPTAFTRVDVEAPGQHEARVSLRLRGQALTLAASLSPGERTDFAAALEDALHAARGERWAAA